MSGSLLSEVASALICIVQVEMLLFLFLHESEDLAVALDGKEECRDGMYRPCDEGDAAPFELYE